MRPGRAEGILLGGNLTVLSSLVGTPHLPSFAGAILLLEDVGERPYRLDRALTQLRSAGALTGLRGLALGAFPHCEEREAPYTARQVLEALALEPRRAPRRWAFPSATQDDNRAVPLGSAGRGRDATEGKLTFLAGLSA